MINIIEIHPFMIWAFDDNKFDYTGCDLSVHAIQDIFQHLFPIHLNMLNILSSNFRHLLPRNQFLYGLFPRKRARVCHSRDQELFGVAG